MSSEEIIVSLTLGEQIIRVGKLWFHAGRGTNRASFEYDKDWLNHPEKFAFDPALSLTTGTFHTKLGCSLFGAIGDSAPDRWGRILMRRAQMTKDKSKNVTPRTLSEMDYLLGVNDEARQGALRFSKVSQENVFLAAKDKTSIPPLLQIANLLGATERFIDDEETASDLKLLLAPGSSLGGARPKACIRDKDHSLAIAKFSRKDDEYNVVLWEAVALTLAEKAKIKIPNWRIEFISDKPVLIINRFDRLGETRIPFLSSMNMLDARDNEQHSYVEMTYALAQHGASPTEDMIELWRRIVFTVMISNTDDHLRNHGFLYERYKGWRLSPAYDLNPTPIHIKPRILSTAIDLYDTTASIKNALSVTKDFRVSATQAKNIIQEVQEAVSEWQSVAKNLGISKTECHYMESAFNYD